MKKTTIYIVLALLCLNFKAQAQDNKAVDVTLKGIQIGQKVPDIAITNLHNYKDANGKPSTTAKLSDFKGKLLILDFWATWCSPCVAMIPKMDSLQKSFGDKIQFLSVTYQTEEEVLPFLEKFEKQQGKRYNLPVVTSSKQLHQLFPHTTLPHYVWIDESGMVKAITDFKDVNAMNIKSAVNNSITLAKKKDVKISYDNKKPFLINNNGGDGTNLIFHSLFTGFSDGLALGYNFTLNINDSPRKITATNQTMLQLFRLAYGGDKFYYGWNRLIFSLKDTTNLKSFSNGRAYSDWLRNDNGFCYELVVPSSLSENAFKIMQEDLRKFFPKYSASVQKIRTKCLVLKRTSEQEKYISTGGISAANFSGLGCNLINSTFNVFTSRLEILYLQNYPYPILNGTGYNNRIDLRIDANLSDLNSINLQLAKYDLILEIDDWVTDMIVISDTNINDKI